MIWNSILIPLVEGITVVAISVLSTFIAGIRGDVAGIEEVEEGLDE
jgi:hypothetical protein